jgi:hypothetical protein
VLIASGSAITVAGELAAAVLVVDEWAEPQRPCSFIGRGQAGSRLFPLVGSGPLPLRRLTFLNNALDM